MTGSAAGKGRTEERTHREDKRAGKANWDALDCVGTGTRSLSKPSPDNACWPNGSQAQRRREERRDKNERRAPAVRWSAWLGSPPTEGPLDGPKNRYGLRRGNDGRCRRESMNGAADRPGRTDVLAEEREQARRWKNGNRLATEELHAKDSGPNELKLSDRGWRRQTQPRNRLPRQPLFAGARG